MYAKRGLVELSPISDIMYPCYAIRLGALAQKYPEQIHQEDGRAQISPYILYRIIKADGSLVTEAISKEELTKTNWATLTTTDLKSLYVLHIDDLPLYPNHLIKDLGKVITVLKLNKLTIKIL